MKVENELSLVYDRKEVVDSAVRGSRRPDGFTQRQAVRNVLDLFGLDELRLEELRDLASQEYGRRITLGITLREKQEWIADKQGQKLAA
jgi:hypothetical protein